jgi:hypothetical protein
MRCVPRTGSEATKCPSSKEGACRSRPVFVSALREHCQFLLTVCGHPLHYTAIARIIRNQTFLRPTERQVLNALMVLQAQGVVRRTFVGVYESTVGYTSTGLKAPFALSA